MSASVFSTRTVVLGSIAVVELACVLGIVCLGPGLVPVEPTASRTDSVSGMASPELAAPVAIDGADRAGPERIALPVRSPAGEDERASPAVRAREPRTEAEFCSRFREVAAGGLAPLEVAVREALVERGPTCRRVAALRVLSESGSPATDEILASAITHAPGEAEATDDSLSRYALEVLVARSASHPSSRRLLERLTWDGEGRVAPPLRAVAASALASSASDEEIDRIASCLQREGDSLVRAGTIEALARRTPSPARDSALEGLGVERVAGSDARAEQAQEGP